MHEIDAAQPDRQQDRRREKRTLLLGLLALGLLSLFLFRCEPSNRMPLGDGGHAEIDDSEFGIGGDTTQAISPGMSVPIDLTITNPHDVAISVSDLAVTVDRVNAPDADRRRPCSVDDFAVEQPFGDLQATVPAEAVRSLSSLGVQQDRWPRVGMVNRPVNQDGCKSAVVTLTFTGSGTLRR
jgi:hypothetical protein